MELSRAADYAVRAVLDVAAFSQPSVTGTSDIARRQRIPAAMLAKIIPQLARAGLLRSRRGAGGGVFLSRSPQEVSLLEVIEAMEGSIVLNCCVRDPGSCPLSRGCAVHEVWIEAQTQLRAHLGGVSIADLLNRQRGLGARNPPVAAKQLLEEQCSS
jgi:Rrf2 family protein